MAGAGVRMGLSATILLLVAACGEAAMPAPAPRFEFYECMVNEKPAFIRVDVARHDRGIDPTRPHSLRIATAFLDPTEEGLDGPQEFETLSGFEDALRTALAPSIFVGVLTNDGRRKWYFYTDDADRDADRAREVARRALPGYEIETASFEDERWSQYFAFLYPNELAWHWITDRRVIESLRKDGDLTHVPRLIDHWAYFPTRDARRAFARALRTRGYRPTGDEDDDGDAPNRFGLHFRRQEPEAPEGIQARTEQLVLLAREHGGVYDGWGSAVVEREGPGDGR